MELKSVIEELYKVAEERKNNPTEGSYTNYLFDKGIDKILKKIGEETSEVIIASKNNDKDEEVSEICDLIYHLIVLMVNQGIQIEDVSKELEKRREKTGNKKAERKVIEEL
jgi:phosphoribosyl-ATP pyrophosphohydrolase